MPRIHHQLLAFSGLILAFFGMSVQPARAETRARKLDGVIVNRVSANNGVVAVMIDNQSAARPQAGLDKAQVVYEAVAEGGIPRFMALFSAINPSWLIGPVRSTRPYFVYYAAEYPAALTHAGGSPDGLATLKKYRLVNIEGLKDPTAKYFFRLAGGGVHSLYTSGKNLLAAVKAAKFDKFHPPYMGWTYTDEPGLNDRVNGKHGVTINIGGGKLYDIRYDYNRAKNVYLRSTGGKPHKDRVTKQQITVKNVVLLFVPKEKVLDHKGHVDLHTIGKGKAILFQNGRALNINWQKKTPSARLVLTLPSAAPVKLNRGSTWITILAAGHPYKVF